MHIFDRFHRGQETPIYPEFYSLAELIAELKKDGFTPSHTLMTDIQRFGITTGVVIAQDGNSGMRVNVDEDGMSRLHLYNGLLDKSNPLFSIANKKYKGKIVTL